MDPQRPEADDSPPWPDRAAGRAHRADHRGGRRLGLTLAVLILGLCGLAGSVVGAVSQFLPRSFSAAQQRQIMAWEMSRRWRTMPAGKIFPPTVSYQLPGLALNSVSGVRLTARRLGIAGQQGCAAATDAAAARVLDRLGCQSVLRASYADSTGSMIVTVGVAVLPDKAAAVLAVRDLSAPARSRARPPRPLHPDLRPAAFPGTLSAGFGSSQRQLNWAASDGPYLILSTAGYSDGRPRVRLSADAYADQEMRSLADGVATAVGTPLGTVPPVPRCPGAPAC
jgi:hypothetical protein